ncbi:MAG: hypothetical protein K2L82_16445 [Lachnospiraceae bacterium]|nr:hypothetical protein [Lachnospiraceae bacterium]
MSGIIYGTEKIRAYDGLVRLCEYAGCTEAWCDELWNEMLSDRELYDEFVYYLEHHIPSDAMKVYGYSLTDLYVWQMEKYNLRRDSGKNTEQCNKEAMVLQAFRALADIKKNPDVFLKRLNDGAGMDKL